MIAQAPIYAGTRGSVLPFPLGSKVPAEFVANEPLLGQEFFGPKGSVARLVKLDRAAGIADPESRTFVYADPGNFEVNMDDTASARICGVAPPNQEPLDDGDYFFVLCDGDVEVVNSDDAEAVVAGQFLANDDDADGGKVKSVTTNFAYGTAPLMALESVTATDAKFLARCLHKLRG